MTSGGGIFLTHTVDLSLRYYMKPTQYSFTQIHTALRSRNSGRNKRRAKYTASQKVTTLQIS